MTLPLPGFEVSFFETQDHRYAFRLTQARKAYHFGSNDRLMVDRWKYAVELASRGYDLTRKDVMNLGRPESCSSEEAEEEEEETEEESNEQEDHEEEWALGSSIKKENKIQTTIEHEENLLRVTELEQVS